MLKRILTATVDTEKWIALPRVVAGILILVHGLGTFNHDHMQGNIAWLTDIHFPAPVFMAYLGKGTELVGGALLVLGLFTRFAAFALVINMVVITFVMGTGNVLENEQLPFLLLLLFLFVMIAGGGQHGLDNLLFRKPVR